MYQYYRYEVGEWHVTRRFNHLAKPVGLDIRRPNEAIQEGRFLIAQRLGWENVPGYHVIEYFHPVTESSVFKTFCAGMTDVVTRLVFGREWGSEFLAWKDHNNLHRGDTFSRILITTDKPLPLAEDYTAQYEWIGIDGQARYGCPILAMLMQGVTGREYVVLPDDIVGIGIQHYLI